MIKFLIVAFLVFFSNQCFAEEATPIFETLAYERTIDGDTFVASGKKIRLWGIDAPEKDHPVSFASTLYLETLLESGNLSCKKIDIDRYKRFVMQCFIDGNDIASDLVKFGLAKDYKKYSGGYYSFEEEIAISKKAGVWENPVSDRL